MLRNKIGQLLYQKGKSKNWLATELNMSYSVTWLLVDRTDLSTTPLRTLQNVADCLEVEVKDLYYREDIK